MGEFITQQLLTIALGGTSIFGVGDGWEEGIKSLLVSLLSLS